MGRTVALAWLLLIYPVAESFTTNKLNYFYISTTSTRQIQRHSRRSNHGALFASTTASAGRASTTSSRLKRTSNFMDWAKKNEIKFGGIQVGEGEGGLGLIATRDIPVSSVVATVPTDMALTVEVPRGGGPSPKLSDSFSSSVDSKILREAPWFVQLSVLLNDLCQNNVEKKAWLETLPRTFDTPIHWSPSEREELQYNFMMNSLQRQEITWKKQYDTCLPQKQVSWEDFVWGCECARSRAFSGSYTGSAFNPVPYALTLLLVGAYVGLHLGTIEQAANGAIVVLCASIWKDFVIPKFLKNKKYIICPFIDMANHKSTGTSADVSFEYFGNAYSLAATKEVKSGEEVYISYGARTNDQLLQYYGFVEKDNPHDVYIMPQLREWDIGALEEACGGRTFPAGRLEKLDRAGLLGAASNTEVEGIDDDDAANLLGGVVLSRSGGLDPAVIQGLRALVSSDEEWKAAGEAIGNFAAEVSPENERLARLVARTAIQMELDSKATTLEEDEGLLKQMRASKSSEAADELAIAFRIEKKKLLKESIEALR